MPWRGPDDNQAYPTLGYLVGEWIEGHLRIPDGYRMGEPYLLTDEMWRFLLRYYRLYEHAEPWPAPDAQYYFGGQLRRSQKWGKDPFGGAIAWAEALGPTRFDGWDADGEPVGAPYPSPLIFCLGVSEDQTANTWLPLLAQARLGPLADLSGLDVGETRILLPGGGRMEPVTTSAKARLGAPCTYAVITESHLAVQAGGMQKTVHAVKRNIAGMDGRWVELTNAYDPSELSEAQVTAESDDPRVYVDVIESQRVEDLADDEALYAELLRQYGDSSRERGGWVNLKGRIMHEARSNRYLESDRRRYFLSEIVAGQSLLVDPVRWALQARPDEALAPGEPITLGFDGSKYRDGTALVASRLSDARQFQIRVWERPEKAPADWRVPSAEVDEVVRATHAAYTVLIGFYDPYRWQDYLDAWARDLGAEIIVEYPTNKEVRMDAAVERYQTAFANSEITHDGSDALCRHMLNTVVVKGSRKRSRPGDLLPSYYMLLGRKDDRKLIDTSVAAVLAHQARAHAIEHNLAPAVPVEPMFAVGWGTRA